MTLPDYITVASSRGCPAHAEVDERWRLEWQHEMAAVSEGLCPRHREPLDAVLMPPRRIAGHCQSCRRFWGINLDTGIVGWWLDRDPRRPEYASTVVPEWMEAQG